MTEDNEVKECDNCKVIRPLEEFEYKEYIVNQCKSCIQY